MHFKAQCIMPKLIGELFQLRSIYQINNDKIISKTLYGI